MERSLLGRKTDIGSSEDVLKKCIRFAYKEMMTAGRFYLKDVVEMESFCDDFKLLLENNNACPSCE